jgi:hypothetical protein
VLGLKSVHGMRSTGETGPARPGGRPAAQVPRARRGHRAVARRQGARRWTGRGKVLSSSTTAKRRLRRAKRAEVGLTEEVGRRWVVESGRRSGGGRLRRGGSALGAVLRLEAKARGKTAGMMSERRRKHGAGERNSAGGRR